MADVLPRSVQLCGGGPLPGIFVSQFDVAGVPEDPPEEAEEDDDGTQVEQQFAVRLVNEDPREQRRRAHHVEDDAQPEEMPAMAQACPLLRLVDGVSWKLHDLPRSPTPVLQRTPRSPRCQWPAVAPGFPWQRLGRGGRARKRSRLSPALRKRGGAQQNGACAVRPAARAAGSSACAVSRLRVSLPRSPRACCRGSSGAACRENLTLGSSAGVPANVLLAIPRASTKSARS